MNKVPSLNIIGCGSVGKTLGYLLIKSKQYQINNILTRSIKTATECAKFFQQGLGISKYEELTAADVTLFAVNDDQLINIIQDLSRYSAVQQSSLAFHCSGAFSSEILLPLKSEALSIASLHPIKSFSQNKKDQMSLEGIFCAIEGDNSACKILQHNFEKLGAKIIPVDTKNKIFYHTATVFSSNYFIALIEIALQLLEQNQIPREQGLTLLEPLMMGTYEQLKKHGTTQALTGPIARGDAALVARQCQALEKFNSDFAQAYKDLGKIALELAIKQNNFSSDVANELKNVLEKNSNEAK